MGASIPYQDREIRAWARRNGHRIVGMFPEEGRSGALDLEDRAALTAAIDLIATGKAEGLVCYSLDRLAREITVQEAILAKVWEEAGGRVFTTDQGEVLRDDPDDPMRTAMRKMAGVMYELDRRLVVARAAPRPPAQGRAGRVRRRRDPLRIHHRPQAARPRPGPAGGRPSHPPAAPGRPVDPQDHRPAQRRADPSQTRRRLAPDHRRPDPSEDSISTFERPSRNRLPIRGSRRLAGIHRVGFGVAGFRLI